MADVRVEVVDWLSALWRRRWLTLAATWTFCGIGWLAVLLLPNQYEASARVYVDADTLLAPLLRDLTMENDAQRQAQTIQHTLLSRANLQQVIASTDLARLATTPAREAELVDSLNKHIRIIPQTSPLTVGLPNNNLFVLSYTSSDRLLAHDVVRSLLSILVETNSGHSREEMERANAFIDKQIATYEEQLRAAERRMAEFQARHVDEIGSNNGNFSARLEAAHQATAAAQAALADAVAKRDRWRSELQSIPQFIDVQGTAPIIVNGQADSPQARLAELRHTLDDLKLRYTDKHPDVIATRKALDELTAQLRQGQVGEGAVPQRPTARMSNPVYEQAQMQLLEAEQNVDAATRHRTQAEEEERRLTLLASTAPAVEAQYSDLTREYGAQHKQYEELLARREQAHMAAAMENSSANTLFRVLEPPQVPIKPSAPNRPVFLTGVLAAGLVLGVGLIFLLHRIEDPVTSTSALAARFRWPVLGSVSIQIDPEDVRERRRRLLLFAAACASLLVAYGGTLLVASHQGVAHEGAPQVSQTGER